MFNNQRHFFVMVHSFKRNAYNNPYCQLNLSTLQITPLKSFCTSKSAATFICEKELQRRHISWKLVISITSESAILSICQWAKLGILKWCLSTDRLFTQAFAHWIAHTDFLHCNKKRMMAYLLQAFSSYTSSSQQNYIQFQIQGIFKISGP